MITDLPTVTLDNWSLVYRDPIDPYTAPELVRPCLSGKVSGDTRFKDGEVITTGTLVWRRGDVIATKRTLYRLGTVDPGYEAAFPNARERLLAAITETQSPS